MGIPWQSAGFRTPHFHCKKYGFLVGKLIFCMLYGMAKTKTKPAVITTTEPNKTKLQFCHQKRKWLLGSTSPLTATLGKISFTMKVKER